MSRLTTEKIEQEITDKGFKAHKIDHYQNLNTLLEISCDQGHMISASLLDIRKSSFKCDKCNGGKYKIVSMPPKKSGTRVIGVDNATQNMGISIFDDGKLVFQTLIKITGTDFEDRIHTIFNMFNNNIIKEWAPDYIILEDIQYQNNYATYKKLAMLLGLLIVAAKNHGIGWEVVPPVTWRSSFGISGRRESAKQQAINKVATMYGIDVIDDVAEAILIGKYFIDTKLNIQKIKKAF